MKGNSVHNIKTDIVSDNAQWLYKPFHKQVYKNYRCLSRIGAEKFPFPPYCL